MTADGKVAFDWRALFTVNLAERRVCPRPGCGWVGLLTLIHPTYVTYADLLGPY